MCEGEDYDEQIIDRNNPVIKCKCGRVCQAEKIKHLESDKFYAKCPGYNCTRIWYVEEASVWA